MANRKDNYQVVVGNVGTVYDGSNKRRAERDFGHYVAMSKNGVGLGLAGGEDVTLLFTDGKTGNQDILKEHVGELSAVKG